MNTTSNKNTQKGFTLIELLVVLAIIGLLSSVVAATTNNARKKAHNAYTTATIRQYLNAIQTYQIEKGKLPYGTVNGAYGGRFCLGRAPNGTTCFTGHQNLTGGDDPVLNDALDDYYASLPTPNPKPITTSSGFTFDGSLYFCQSYILTINGQPINRCDHTQLLWNLESPTAKCVIPGSTTINYSLGTSCLLNIYDPISG